MSLGSWVLLGSCWLFLVSAGSSWVSLGPWVPLASPRRLSALLLFLLLLPGPGGQVHLVSSCQYILTGPTSIGPEIQESQKEPGKPGEPGNPGTQGVPEACVAPPGSPWLFLAAPGSSLLLLSAPGSSWLLLAAPEGSSWLSIGSRKSQEELQEAPGGVQGGPGIEPRCFQEETGGSRRILGGRRPCSSLEEEAPLRRLHLASWEEPLATPGSSWLTGFLGPTGSLLAPPGLLLALLGPSWTPL